MWTIRYRDYRGPRRRLEELLLDSFHRISGVTQRRKKVDARVRRHAILAEPSYRRRGRALREPPTTNGGIMLRTRISPWIRIQNPSPAASVRLICFPFSGGSARVFAGWRHWIPSDVELVAVQYPGREDRLMEPAAGDVQQMATLIADELLDLQPVPCALFGHSLGALVAYETALRLRDAGRAPAVLFPSSCTPPTAVRGGTIHMASDERLWSTMCALGGIAPEIADDLEMAELLVPLLRADVAVDERYRTGGDVVPLSCQIRCYHGRRDDLVTEASLAGWADVSSGRFTMLSRPGGHLHLFDDPSELVSDALSLLAEFRME